MWDFGIGRGGLVQNRASEGFGVRLWGSASGEKPLPP